MGASVKKSNQASVPLAYGLEREVDLAVLAAGWAIHDELRRGIAPFDRLHEQISATMAGLDAVPDLPDLLFEVFVPRNRGLDSRNKCTTPRIRVCGLSLPDIVASWS
jgi:hypothetical protein